MRSMHEARYTEERGWYVVDPRGHLVHVDRDGELRAAFFGQDRQSAEALARRLNGDPTDAAEAKDATDAAHGADEPRDSP